jgi:hypothetical protein
MDEVHWTGRKSKHSATKGSGGYTAEAYGAELHVQAPWEGGREQSWYFTVRATRRGRAASLEEAKAAAVELARRLEQFDPEAEARAEEAEAKAAEEAELYWDEFGDRI